MKAPLQLSHSLTFVRVASSFLQYSIDGVLVKTSKVFVLKLKVFDFGFYSSKSYVENYVLTRLDNFCNNDICRNSLSLVF